VAFSHSAHIGASPPVSQVISLSTFQPTIHEETAKPASLAVTPHPLMLSLENSKNTLIEHCLPVAFTG
jgi:hypothetical protein